MLGLHPACNWGINAKMAPNIQSLKDLQYLVEAFRPGSQLKAEDLLYTCFTWFDQDDHAYFGQVQKPKVEMGLEEVSSALEMIPDEDIYPHLESHHQKAPDHLNSAAPTELRGVYLKRPPVGEYNVYKALNTVENIPETLLDEVAALQEISQHGQHPNLVRFHGCRVRQGRITALIIDKYEDNLRDSLRQGKAIDKDRILNGLDSAVQHLHSLGLAHNDINPGNIMVDENTGEPVLVDFGSSHKIGASMRASRGTPGWTEDDDDYATSKESHDTAGLDKIRKWLNEPA
ncbi:kinase-like protein [Thozetella sp. PMI_491]|nr:kinase-like protein [Thozetella sp. PMI_491]